MLRMGVQGWYVIDSSDEPVDVSVALERAKQAHHCWVSRELLQEPVSEGLNSPIPSPPSEVQDLNNVASPQQTKASPGVPPPA